MDFDVFAKQEYEAIKKRGNNFEKTQKTNINAKSFEEGAGNGNVFGGGSTFKGSQFPHDLKNLDDNKIKHILEGSANSNHKWEKLVPDKNWNDIENIIKEVIETGSDDSYKRIKSKIKNIKGEIVEVAYIEKDGIIKISNAWVR